MKGLDKGSNFFFLLICAFYEWKYLSCLQRLLVESWILIISPHMHKRCGRRGFNCLWFAALPVWDFVQLLC